MTTVLDLEPLNDFGGVYRLYDVGNACLYIGQTGKFRSRFYDHTKKVWWSEVVSYTIEILDVDLDEVEIRAIIAEQPRYNVRFKRWRICERCSMPASREHQHRCPHGPTWWEEENLMRAIQSWPGE